jgi:diguanylate cyclase (GGDEF)-like protein
MQQILAVVDGSEAGNASGPRSSRRGPIPRSVAYGMAGLALSAGAPLGWLAARVLASQDPRALWPAVLSELAGHPALYAYLTLGTALAFCLYGAVLGYVGDQLLSANALLRDLALTDPSTRLKNVRYFRERLDEECARYARTGVPVTLLVGDVDLFKAVNDRHGHSVGDQVLAAVAQAILGSIRACDSACRVGGEEFAIICPGATLQIARSIAERIRQAVSTIVVHAPHGEVSVTLSVGVAAQSSQRSGQALFQAADTALYAAKAAGRNCVVVEGASELTSAGDQRHYAR